MNNLESEILKEITNDITYEHEKWVKNILLNYATPPIKGEITKGKLKWRGIRLCIQNNYFDGTKEWVEQRGVKIGEEFIIKPFFKI